MDTGDSGHSRGRQRRRKHGRKGEDPLGKCGRRPAGQASQAGSEQGERSACESHLGRRMSANALGTWHSRGLINSDENRASRPWGGSSFGGSEGAAREGVCKQKGAGTSQPARSPGLEPAAGAIGEGVRSCPGLRSKPRRSGTEHRDLPWTRRRGKGGAGQQGEGAAENPLDSRVRALSRESRGWDQLSCAPSAHG